MDAKEQLQDDVRAERVSVDRLIDLLFACQSQLQKALQSNAELEKKLASSPTTKVDEPYSMKAETREVVIERGERSAPPDLAEREVTRRNSK